MARKPTGRPTGRPKKPIDWTQFEQLCALQCTQSEIGSFLNIHHETLSIRVKDNYGEDYPLVYKRFQEAGKSSLRRNQFVLSKKNASVAIWLGKIWLGQKDPGLDETKKDTLHEIRNAIREIAGVPRISDVERPALENQQPILDQRPVWEEAKVPIELGTKDTLGGDA